MSVSDERTRGELLRGDERFRLLVENAPDLVLLMAVADGRCEYANPASIAVLGYTPEEFYRSPHFIRSLLLPGWQSFFEEQWRRLVSGEDVPKSYEYPIIHKNGQTRWLNQRNAVIYDDAEHPVAIEAIVSDVTGRRHADKSLKEANERLQAIFNALPDLMFELDRSGVIYDYRARHHPELLFMAPEKFIGRSMMEILPEEAVTVTAKALAEAAENGCSTGHSYRLDLPDATHWFEFSVSAVGDSGVPDARFLAIVRDITARRRAEFALRDSEDRYRNLFETMMDGFALHEIVCDAEGAPIDYVFLEVNTAFETLTGLKREDIIGKRVREVVSAIEPFWIKTYGEVALTGKSARFTQFSAALGKHFEVVVFSPAYGQFAAIFEDATELKEMQLKLEEANRRLGESGGKIPG